MTSIDAPSANTDLWTTYLRGQVRSWLDPFGLAPVETVDVLARPLADMAAAAMSGWMSLVAGMPVQAMYNGNKTQVTQFVHEQAIDPDAIEIPAQYMRPAACLPTTQLEEWAITTVREREPAYAR